MSCVTESSVFFNHSLSLTQLSIDSSTKSIASFSKYRKLASKLTSYSFLNSSTKSNHF